MKSESKIQFEIRTKLALTLSAFAKENNISRSTISSWANKKRPVSPDHVIILRGAGISQGAIEKPWEKVNF